MTGVAPQVPSGDVQAAQKAVADQLESFKQEYGLFEPGLSARAEETGVAPVEVLTADAADRLLGVLVALPHGVVKMSHAVKGCGGAVLCSSKRICSSATKLVDCLRGAVGNVVEADAWQSWAHV